MKRKKYRDFKEWVWCPWSFGSLPPYKMAESRDIYELFQDLIRSDQCLFWITLKNNSIYLFFLNEVSDYICWDFYTKWL